MGTVYWSSKLVCVISLLKCLSEAIAYYSILRVSSSIITGFFIDKQHKNETNDIHANTTNSIYWLMIVMTYAEIIFPKIYDAM